jgi:hypothetical protein
VELFPLFASSFALDSITITFRLHSFSQKTGERSFTFRKATFFLDAEEDEEAGDGA